MRTPRLLHKGQLINLYKCFWRSIQYASNTEVIFEVQRLPAHKMKLPNREPFMKNLFIGKFDKDFMVFPQPQEYPRYQEFLEWLQPIETCINRYANKNDTESYDNDELFHHLKELNTFRGRISEQYHGLELCNTEMSKLLEITSQIPWLSTYFVKNYIAPVDFISKYCTEIQKTKYLPQIASRDLIPTFCITEASSGPNVKNIQTEAVLSKCEKYYILNGEKTFVINGRDSSLFLVFALCATDSGCKKKHETLSTFIVERNCEGISIKDNYETIGETGLLSTVSFKDTIIPKENMIGNIGDGTRRLIDVLSPENHNTAAQAIGILRNFINTLTWNILQRKHHDKNMNELESVQGIIGKMSCDLYGMESILYLTLGMSDELQSQDNVVERIIVDTYCAEKCVENIYAGLQLLGAKSYLKNNPYIQTFKNALSLTLFDKYSYDSYILIALLGLQYAGKHYKEHIHKLRNPFMYPRYCMKQGLSYMREDEKPLNLDLHELVHPSLKEVANILELCIWKLRKSTFGLLFFYGSDISSHHMHLHRLGEIAILTYVLMASLSRASRSYCIGFRNSEHEKNIALSLVFPIHERITTLMGEILLGNDNRSNAVCKTVAEKIFNDKGYFIEHPLKRLY